MAGVAVEPLDAAIIIGFVVYAAASGLAGRRAASRGLEEYFLAGRQLGGVRAGLSMAATQFSADTPLLVTGLIASSGIFSLWRLWVYGLAFLMLGFLLAPCWRRAGVLTDAELAERRYGGRAAQVLRLVKAVYFGLVFNCTVLAMVLFAAARIAEPFLLWHAWLPSWMFSPLLSFVQAVGAPLGSGSGSELWLHSADNLISLCAILALTTFYSTTGGLRSVVRTDILQLGLALLGTLAYAAVVVNRGGGMAGIHAALPAALSHHPTGMNMVELLAFTPDTAHDVGSAVLGVLALQWLIQMNADGTGYLAQRCMACRSDEDARRATVVFAFTQVLLRSLLWLPIGLALLVLLPPEPPVSPMTFAGNREASYVIGMATLLPSGLRGLLLAAMLAALASTLDTHLNWGASYFTNDLYRRFYCQLWRRREPDTRQLVRVARASNLLIVVLSLGIMTRLNSIQTAWKISLLLGAGMGVMLVLRWLWWRITAVGELAAIVTSMVLAPALLQWLPDAEAARLLWMAFGATVSGVLASLWSPADDNARLLSFYRQVRPPGFWEPQRVAAGEAPGEDRRRLRSGLWGMVSCSLGLFCLLVGLGTWIVGGTVPRFIPWTSLWVPGLLLVGLASLTHALKGSSRQAP